MTATATGATAHPSLAPLSRPLPPDLAERYDRDGFFIVEAALTDEQVGAVNAEVVQVLRGRRGEVRGLVPSAEDWSDEDVLRAHLAVHEPHKLSPLLEGLVHEPHVVEPLTRIIGPDVKAVQVMAFVKSEGRPGQAWHQDEFFIPTRDRSLTAAWIALDDATVENGCLWVIPGSHRAGVLHPTREQRDPRYDCTEEAFGFDEADAVPVEVLRGCALLFNGYLLHRSLRNTGAHGYRRALVTHYMSATSLLPWKAPAPGQHMAGADYRDIIMVAGTDPYAWKGVEDLGQPMIRPDGDGGCAKDPLE